MTITAEQVQWLANGNPPSSERDHAEWITDLARALIASEAARKLAEERLAKAAHSLARCADFIERGLFDRAGPVVREARALLKDIDNG